MTRAQNNQLNALDRRLFHSYRQAATTAVQRHERAIRRLQREAATADEDRLRYLTWQVERTGGLADNIAIEIASAGETARRMIERENLNLFAGGYRDTVLGINRQLGQAGISTNMQMMNRDAINAIFNGESHGLGRGAFEQVVVLDRQRGNFYYRMAAGELVETRTIIGKLRNELSQAITLGESIPQITRRIINVSCGTAQTAKGKRAEARRIARTETIRALNQGKHLAALQASEEYDIPMNKKWLSVADERTRTTPPDEFDHAKMNGVTVGLKEAFIVGGEELQYPGDPNGSAANVIHCRCTHVNVVDIEGLRQQRLESERQSGIIEPTYHTLNDGEIAAMQEKSNRIYDNATGEERDASDKYTDNGYKSLNKRLHEDGPLLSMQDTADNLDSLIGKFALDDDIILFSGTSKRHYSGWKVGDTKEIPAYFSTSVKRDEAVSFLDRNPANSLMIEVRTPRGVKGMYIGENTAMPGNEYEFLLGRGLEYRVLEREGNRMVLEVVNR